jgi:hypothetical protein
MQVDFYTELWLAALSRRVIVLACRRSGPSFLHLFLSTQHIPLATPPSRPVLTTTCSPSPVRPSSSRRDHTARRHRKLTCRVINTLIIMFETARKMFAAQPFRACAHMFAPPSWVLETSPSADPYYRPRDIVAPKTPVATQRPSEATHILHKTRKRKRNEIPKFSPWKKRKFAIVEEIIEEPTETALPSTDHAEQLPVAVAADNSGSNAEDNFGLPTPLSSPPEDENLVVTAHMPGDESLRSRLPAKSGISYLRLRPRSRQRIKKLAWHPPSTLRARPALATTQFIRPMHDCTKTNNARAVGWNLP